ncbi:MAG TPA: type IV toxin-antitoxin system AbiEi family antitoxin [Terriglobales bacterium]|nr:type IV toxin-antitoxin system AbiEi family antitoxin [Terriglobales bacterium]
MSLASKGIGTQLDIYIPHLKTLRFIRDVSVTASKTQGDREFETLLSLRTPTGQFKLVAEVKSVYPNAALTNSIIATRRTLKTDKNVGYIAFLAQPARLHEEKLVEAGVNFVDAAGNLNLTLGDNYQAVILGRREQKLPEVDSTKISSRAGVQLLFTLAAHPGAANWPTRQLAEVAGISKSIVARLKHRFVHSQILHSVGKELHLAAANEIRQELLVGYSEALYPRILLGRFRSAIRDTSEFLSHVSGTLADSHTRWALTGGPAAHLLQHYYRGEEIPIFVDKGSSDIQQRLRLLPDRAGPIKLLAAFGTLAFWRSIDNYTIAHPWLIFAELMQSEDSRAHEAAQELYTQFLSDHDRTLTSANQ